MQEKFEKLLQIEQKILGIEEKENEKVVLQQAPLPELESFDKNGSIQNQEEQRKERNVEQQWTIPQLKLLQKLYQESGPCWGFISSHFKNRSQTSIKNKFRNGLTRAAKILYDFEANVNKNKSRNISSSLLFTMINFANKIQKMIRSLQLPINFDSMIFQFRTSILKLIFRNEKFEQEDLVYLIKLIKTLNSKIRCFGAFKGNQRRWKLNEQKLRSICQFDSVIKIKQEEKLKVEQNQKIVIERIEQQDELLKNNQNQHKLITFFLPVKQINEYIKNQQRLKIQQ